MNLFYTGGGTTCYNTAQASEENREHLYLQVYWIIYNICVTAYLTNDAHKLCN